MTPASTSAAASRTPAMGVLVRRNAWSLGLLVFLIGLLVLMGGSFVLLIALIYVVLNLLADVATILVTPKLRTNL